VVVEQGTPPCGFGFSTKIEDPETGLVYYGYRYLRTLDGRWTSRDPIEEKGGANLYGFAKNDPCDYYDYLGQDGGSVLTLKFRKDTSVKENYEKPVPNQMSIGMMNFNFLQTKITFLKTKLKECSKYADCGGKNKIPEVISDLDGLFVEATVQPKMPISDRTPEGIKNFRDWAGETKEGIVPVTLTSSDLNKAGEGEEALGRAGKGTGILLSIRASQYSLAHELGHVGGYKITGDDTKDKINGPHHVGDGFIMSEVSGEQVDHDWCKAVIELAK